MECSFTGEHLKRAGSKVNGFAKRIQNMCEQLYYKKNSLWVVILNIN